MAATGLRKLIYGLRFPHIARAHRVGWAAYPSRACVDNTPAIEFRQGQAKFLLELRSKLGPAGARHWLKGYWGWSIYGNRIA